MSITIPEFTRSPYSIIVLSSVIIGIAVAALLMKRAKVPSRQIMLTSLLALFCIFNCAIVLAVATTGYLGFAGLGGALGLIIAIISSVLIFREHERVVFASWVITAPLMYSLSKNGCTLAGCCRGFEYHGPFALVYGEDSCFPVQPLDTLLFMLVFIISLIIFTRAKDKLNTGLISLLMSGGVRIFTDSLRESHQDILISQSQVITVIVCGIGIACIVLLKKITKEGTDNGK